MTNSYKNLCSRCGKERILSKSYTEDLTYSTVTIKEMVCPDKECQEHVSKENKRREEKQADIQMKHAQRMMERKAAMDAARVAVEK